MSPGRIHRQWSPRKLPTLPGPRPLMQSRRRPLPRIPRSLICKTCRTCITSQNVLFPESAVRWLPASFRSCSHILDNSFRSAQALHFGVFQGKPLYSRRRESLHSLTTFESDSDIRSHSSYNINSAPPNVQLMKTGAHTMQELTCSSCSTYMGWKIVRAHDTSESWKDGNFLLELEHLCFQPDSLDDPSNHWQLSCNSDSEHST